MFTPDRNAPTPGGFLRETGIFAGTIAFPDEIDCNQRGETRVRLRFETDAGTATDDYVNAENLWWKLNVLLAAADPEGKLIPVTDGAGLDFSKNQNFIAFLKHFEGKRITFAHYEETFTKRDGSQGTSWRARPLDPRKKPESQIPKQILGLLNAPKTQPTEPDEIPF